MLTTTHLARRTAIAVAVVTAAILLIRIYLAVIDNGSVVASVSYLSQFFTILTNTLILILMTMIGLGKTVRYPVFVPIIVAIIGVGILYHALLAHLWSPQGLQMIADQGVHTVVPLLALAWWFMFTDICAVRWKDALRSVIWPLIYVVYALVRAKFSHFYPYPFLDLKTLGWSGLTQSVLGLTVAFFILGLVIVSIARLRCNATAQTS